MWHAAWLKHTLHREYGFFLTPCRQSVPYDESQCNAIVDCDEICTKSKSEFHEKKNIYSEWEWEKSKHSFASSFVNFQKRTSSGGKSCLRCSSKKNVFYLQRSDAVARTPLLIMCIKSISEHRWQNLKRLKSENGQRTKKTEWNEALRQQLELQGKKRREK